MTNLRLSTLSLTLAIFVTTLGSGNPSFAAKPNCETNPSHPSCNDDPDSSITYTVELTGRVFKFGSPAVDVTADNKEENLLPDPAVPLSFFRPGGDVLPCAEPFEAACLAWDAVFAACENFFGPDPIPGIGPTAMVVSEFTVPPGNWRINKFGGVRLQMSIPFDSMGDSPPGPDGEHFSVSLQLIGDTLFESPDTPWLPDPGDSIRYQIFDASIIGRTAKGVRPKKGCVSGGSAPTVDFDPDELRELVITAIP